MLASYIGGLYKHLEKVEKKQEQAKQSTAAELQAVMSMPVKPLEQQIVEFFRSLSPTQINRPWGINEITLHLEGKYRDRPHPQLVAVELRKIGWQRRRVYGPQEEGGGRRYWFPPA